VAAGTAKAGGSLSALRARAAAALTLELCEVVTITECGRRGVRSCADFDAGDVITPFSASTESRSPSRHTIQVDDDRHIEPAPDFLRYVNHGCDPNVAFDVTRKCLIALRPIRDGDDLLFFYPSTEWQMNEPFDCDCGSPDCVGEVCGAAEMDRDILVRHLLAPHIVRRLDLHG